jgi:hypothetical protein
MTMAWRGRWRDARQSLMAPKQTVVREQDNQTGLGLGWDKCSSLVACTHPLSGTDLDTWIRCSSAKRGLEERLSFLPPASRPSNSMSFRRRVRRRLAGLSDRLGDIFDTTEDTQASTSLPVAGNNTLHPWCLGLTQTSPQRIPRQQ